MLCQRVLNVGKSWHDVVGMVSWTERRHTFTTKSNMINGSSARLSIPITHSPSWLMRAMRNTKFRTITTQYAPEEEFQVSHLHVCREVWRPTPPEHTEHPKGVESPQLRPQTRHKSAANQVLYVVSPVVPKCEPVTVVMGRRGHTV